MIVLEILALLLGLAAIVHLFIALLAPERF